MELCKEEKYQPYKFFKGSPMSKGIFQFDMWGVDKNNLLYDWSSLKEDVIKYGVCNSLFTAQMPVACQTSDTKIITQDGVKTFREICEDNGIDVDEIEKNEIGGVWFDFSKEINVRTMDGFSKSDKIYYNGHTEIYEIEMEDGTYFKCSSEHKFLVNRNDEQLWIKVKDLEDGDDIVNVS